MKTRTKYPNKSRNSEVVVKTSSVAKGLGVFVKRSFTRGDFITWYSGYNCKKPKSQEYVIDNDGKNLVGHKFRKGLIGVAQLANSGVCPLVTNVTNNCDFIGDGRGGIWLVAKHFIPKGSELFVHYSSEYWNGKEHIVGKTEEEKTCLKIHSKVAKIVERMTQVSLGSCRHPNFTDDFMEFKYDLLSHTRLCPNSHSIHHDNFFRVRLFKTEESFKISYYCDSCDDAKPAEIGEISR